MALQNGLTSIASAPTHPHTSRVEAPRCVDCHYDSKALGLGEGRLTRDGETGRLRVEPIYDSRNAGLKIDFPLDALVSAGRGTLQGTSHSLSRPFNSEELRRIVGIVPCLPCHDRYDDPVWQRSGPYDLTPECRRALGNVTEKRKGGSGESRGPRTR
jgi:hypothetical protein